MMNAASEEINSSTFQDVCNIVVLYDGDLTRARALSACDFLVQQFWDHVELNFHWWRTDFLADAAMANVAARDALTADFLIMASENRQPPSPALERWFESWVDHRGAVQGALVDLPASRAANTFELAEARRGFFREICRRGNFDYLTTLAETSPDYANRRGAGAEMGGIVDDILGNSRPPSHSGLNE